MAKYKLQQKTNADGTTQDIKLDASSVDLSNYVDLTSAQTISGVKTFSNYAVLNDKEIRSKNTTYAYTDTSVGSVIGTEHPFIKFIDKNNAFYGSISPSIEQSENRLHLWLLQKNGAGRFYTFGNSSFYCTYNGSLGDVDLGSNVAKWKDLYMSGSIKDGTNTFTLPSATGTLALQSEIPTVPTNISAFTNDSGYITSSSLSSYLPLTAGSGKAITGDLYLNAKLYGPQQGSNPRNRYDSGLYFFNCNASTTSSYNFGLYQWNDVFQFTTRTSSNNTYKSTAFEIDGDTGKTNFSIKPSVNGSDVALTSEMTDTFYATCSTEASTKDKVATISGSSIFTLRVGVVVGVRFSNTNTFSASATAGYVTLNVNNTGAKNIYWNNTGSPTGTNTKAFGYADRLIYYMYDGTYWVFLSASTDDNSTGYLSYTATSVGNTNTNIQYLIGKRTVSSNGTNYYNSGIYFKGNSLICGSLGNGTYTYTLPSKAGTIALTNDLPDMSKYPLKLTFVADCTSKTKITSLSLSTSKRYLVIPAPGQTYFVGGNNAGNTTGNFSCAMVSSPYTADAFFWYTGSTSSAFLIYYLTYAVIYEITT